ncbi:MAG: alpha/beta fold hydrolase [Rhodobacterales bacterium]|nr:alpha/beta fold hydrolase [Rhodobacterales bacterium]
MPPDLLFDGPVDAPVTIALAHGAGAPMDSPFMAAFAQGLAARGIRVARFEFPYMAGRRAGGTKRPPDRGPVLVDTWMSVINHLGPERLVIGGKSMGGRIASMVADGAGVKGLVCLGYPFHGPGRALKEDRIVHLRALKTPALILQGTRDTMGTADEVPDYPLSPAIRVHWLEDGDHGLKPRKKSGRSEAQNWDEAIGELAAFALGL